MAKAIVTEYDVRIPYPIREPIRIAHVSDLHERRADDILQMVRRAHPDLIVVTGDTFERYDNRPQYDFYHRPVKRLIINIIHYTNWLLNKLMPPSRKPDVTYSYRFLQEAMGIAPVYLSLGNHEQKLLDTDYRFFEQNGIVLLDNADTDVHIKGADIRLGGMSSWEYESWLESYINKPGCKLLLCHHPERFEPFIRDTDVALTLSGHTHGGQVRIGKRGRGFFVPGQGILGKYAHGRFFGGRLIVSAGCANTVAFPRLFNPRELVVINLKGEDGADGAI